MADDLFEVLGVNRDSKEEDIKKAYRLAAIKFNPETHQADRTFCEKKFAQASAAYEVLVDPRLRAIYEQYGDDGLHSGVSEKLGLKPFVPSNPKVIFEKFFGTPNPHAVSIVPSAEELMANVPDSKIQAPPTLGTLVVSLEEVFTGASKKFSFSRKKAAAGETELRTIDVPILRGMADCSQLTFKGEGDRGGDLLLVIEEQRHPRFKRAGDDLVFKARITLAQALLGCVVEVQTLDGRLLRIAVNEVVSPGWEKVVIGEGMPILSADPRAAGPPKRGNLRIAFKVEYPSSLSDRQRQLIHAALVEPEPKTPAPPKQISPPPKQKPDPPGTTSSSTRK